MGVFHRKKRKQRKNISLTKIEIRNNEEHKNKITKIFWPYYEA